MSRRSRSGNVAVVTRMSAQSFTEFVSNVADALDPVVDATSVLVFDDHRPGVLMLKMNGREAAAEAVVDQLMAERPRAVALCSRAQWSPDANPLQPAWTIVAVCPELSARFYVAQDGGPWYPVGWDRAPLFMRSSAAALRRAMDAGEPLRWREGLHPDLLRQPRPDRRATERSRVAQ